MPLPTALWRGPHDPTIHNPISRLRHASHQPPAMRQTAMTSVERPPALRYCCASQLRRGRPTNSFLESYWPNEAIPWIEPARYVASDGQIAIRRRPRRAMTTTTPAHHPADGLNDSR